ncbi:YhgE/Pip family protein [Kineococcus terrestris]|uniref:YhgE/Pip family protein n=1 Tax=Kineococcus terrestris TaxID=2044856 RepID=UPI0034DB15E9
MSPRPTTLPATLPGLELARFGRATITRLALLVVVVVPLLYGGLYLSANHDPVAHLDRLRAAVVDEDVPATATGPDGASTPVRAGADLVEQLTGPDADAGFTWEATTAERAREGLADGDYAAVLTVPRDFSAALASTTGDAPRSARLSVTTDDAVNHVVSQVTDTVATSVRTGLQRTATAGHLDGVYLAFSDVHDSLDRAADGADELTDGAARTDDGARELLVGLGDLDRGAARLVDGTGDLRTGSRELADGTAALAGGAAAADTGARELAGGLGALREGTAALPQRTAELADGSRRVADGAARLAQAVDGLDTGALDAVAGAGADLGPALDDALERARAVAAASGDPQLQEAVEQLARARAGLDDERVAATVADAAARARQLAADVDALAAGADAVATGNRALADAAPALAAGAASAAGGADELAAGTSSLAAGARSAAAGAGELASGAAAVDDGARSLLGGTEAAATGAGALADGTGRLTDGAGELAGSLREGAGQVPALSAAQREQRAGVVADPVQAQRVVENPVAHYADGLAPLFVPVALWVGGMVTYMVLRALSPRALASTVSPVRAALAGWVPGALLAVAQGLVLGVVLLTAVGISSPRPAATLAFTVLVAVVFTALHQCLVALFGGAGRLGALVLLVLQLTSTGGTYPVQTAPGFFQVLHPLLPMTYAADGLRHLVVGGSGAAVWSSAAVLAGFGLLGLAVSVLAAHRRRTWSPARLHPALAL